MSDVLDETGLTLKTLPEITADLEAGYRDAYGDDVNLDQDSPDGQAIGIQAQEGIDMREILRDVYNSFDPDTAQGIALDRVSTLNGVQRKGGSFTVTPVDITVDRTVMLKGLDTASESIDIPAGVYMVKDDAGTQFALVASTTISAGLHALAFRAVTFGAVQVTIGTITTPVTAIAGVVSINNSATVTTQGVDEESDAALRIRRERSVAGPSQGYTDSIESAVLELDGVTACICEENVTDTTDDMGIPPHSIWVIVEGGSDADIAEAIYATRSAGSGMRGDTVVAVTRPNGRTIDIKFDRSGTEDLYARFNIVVIGGGIIDEDNLKVLIVQNVTYEIGESASNDKITCYVKSINQKYQITGTQLSKDGSTWAEVVDLDSIANQFELATSRITIS